MIVSTPREPLWAFINARIGIPWSSDFRAIGIVRDDCLMGVVAYNGFTGRTCCMHDAIDDPTVIDRTFVRAVFEYPFIQCDLLAILAQVDEDNKHALGINKRLGFKEVHRLNGAANSGKDLIFLQMLRSECRWIKGLLDGKQERTAGPGLYLRSGEAGPVQQRSDQHADLGQPPRSVYALG